MIAETPPEILTRLYDDRYKAQAELNKAKTGRPKMDPIMEEYLRDKGQWDEESETRRTLQNRLHMTRAMLVLSQAPNYTRFAWLIDKKTILSELGRIEKDSTLLKVARVMCKQKPNTQGAVAMIRGWRRGTTPKPDAQALAQVIINTVTAYIQSHPGTTVEQIQEACERAANNWEQEED